MSQSLFCNRHFHKWFLSHSWQHYLRKYGLKTTASSVSLPWLSFVTSPPKGMWIQPTSGKSLSRGKSYEDLDQTSVSHSFSCDLSVLEKYKNIFSICECVWNTKNTLPLPSPHQIFLRLRSLRVQANYHLSSYLFSHHKTPFYFSS